MALPAVRVTLAGGQIVLRRDDREYAVAFTPEGVVSGRQGARE